MFSTCLSNVGPEMISLSAELVIGATLQNLTANSTGVTLLLINVLQGTFFVFRIVTLPQPNGSGVGLALWRRLVCSCIEVDKARRLVIGNKNFHSSNAEGLDRVITVYGLSTVRRGFRSTTKRTSTPIVMTRSDPHSG